MRLPQHRALIALLLAAALAVTWLRPLDALAERHVEAGLKRALIAFASARTPAQRRAQRVADDRAAAAVCRLPLLALSRIDDGAFCRRAEAACLSFGARALLRRAPVGAPRNHV